MANDPASTRSLHQGQPYEVFEQREERPESGLGVIFNSLKRSIVRQPPESKSNSKLEKQKRVILDRFREDRLS